MHKHTQSTLLKQAAIMATLALESTTNSDMTRTIKDLKSYQASLMMVKDGELKPFAHQAQKLVRSAIKYLHQRTDANLEVATHHRDKLSDMMRAHMGRE